jgi:hypothetical protein
MRMERTDGGVHTVTVIGGLNADNAHPGQIEVVDNSGGVMNIGRISTTVAPTTRP